MANVNLLDKLKATLDYPALFNLTQLAISGTQSKTRQLIRDGLQLKAGERLLDVCCGTGEFANVALGPYLGIDINSKYIEYAQHKYGVGGGHPERQFVNQDICSVEFRRDYGTFPKAMFINSMHHLSVEQNLAVLEGVARVTSERLVIVDMDPNPDMAISRFLARQDRGDYIRPLNEQVAMTQKFFEVEQASYYYSGLCGQTLIICKVK